MGCLTSKPTAVLHAARRDNAEEPLPASAFSQRGAAQGWLQELGLPQYAACFEDAGFSDWELLATLTEADLDAIQAHTGRVMPPGHRKKLLMASRQMGATYGHAHGHGPYDGGPAWAGSSTSGVLVAQAGRQLTPSSSFGAMRTATPRGSGRHAPPEDLSPGLGLGLLTQHSGAGSGSEGSSLKGSPFGYIASPTRETAPGAGAGLGASRPGEAVGSTAGPAPHRSVSRGRSFGRIEGSEASSGASGLRRSPSGASAAAAAAAVSAAPRARKQWEVGRKPAKGALVVSVGGGGGGGGGLHQPAGAAGSSAPPPGHGTGHRGTPAEGGAMLAAAAALSSHIKAGSASGAASGHSTACASPTGSLRAGLMATDDSTPGLLLLQPRHSAHPPGALLPSHPDPPAAASRATPEEVDGSGHAGGPLQHRPAVLAMRACRSRSLQAVIPSSPSLERGPPGAPASDGESASSVAAASSPRLAGGPPGRFSAAAPAGAGSGGPRPGSPQGSGGTDMLTGPGWTLPTIRSWAANNNSGSGSGNARLSGSGHGGSPGHGSGLPRPLVFPAPEGAAGAGTSHHHQPQHQQLGAVAHRLSFFGREASGGQWQGAGVEAAAPASPRNDPSAATEGRAACWPFAVPQLPPRVSGGGAAASAASAAAGPQQPPSGQWRLPDMGQHANMQPGTPPIADGVSLPQAAGCGTSTSSSPHAHHQRHGTPPLRDASPPEQPSCSGLRHGERCRWDGRSAAPQPAGPMGGGAAAPRQRPSRAWDSASPNGAADNAMARLPREAAGPTTRSAAAPGASPSGGSDTGRQAAPTGAACPPGTSAGAAGSEDAGGPPRPTPGRQLDLEALAAQLQRITARLGAIAQPAPDSGAAGEAQGRPEGRGAAPAGRPLSAAAAAKPLQQQAQQQQQQHCGSGLPVGTDARLAAMEGKRRELQLLHDELVSRTEALRTSAGPAGYANPGSAAAAAAAQGQPGVGNTPGDGRCGLGAAGAAGAVAEVEARIRAKLAELVQLTRRRSSADGDCNGRSSGGSGPSARSECVPASASGGGGSGSVAPSRALDRKRWQVLEQASAAAAAAGMLETSAGKEAPGSGGGSGAHVARHGGRSGQQRQQAAAEAALRADIRELLDGGIGRRKREAGARGPDEQEQHPGGQGQQQGRAAKAGRRSSSGSGGDSGREGGLPAPVHGHGGGGALRDELMSIDARVRARVCDARAAPSTPGTPGQQ